MNPLKNKIFKINKSKYSDIPKKNKKTFDKSTSTIKPKSKKKRKVVHPQNQQDGRPSKSCSRCEKLDIKQLRSAISEMGLKTQKDAYISELQTLNQHFKAENKLLKSRVKTYRSIYQNDGSVISIVHKKIKNMEQRLNKKIDSYKVDHHNFYVPLQSSKKKRQK